MKAKDLRQKTFAVDLKATAEGNGSYSGLANATGKMDRDMEVLAGGCFTNIEEFIRDGFSPVGHNWKELPVGYVDAAKETKDGLEVVCSFHSTQAAQDARTVVLERIKAKKSVGLSIGFAVIKSMGFPSPADMAAYCSKMDIPFDLSSVPDGYDDWCRLILEVVLYEVSIVPVPANQYSGVGNAKVLGDGPRASRSLSDQTDALLEEAKDFIDRLTDLREDRGRPLGTKAKGHLLAALPELVTVCEQLKALAEGDEPEMASQDDIRALEIRQLEQRARLVGAA